MQTYNLENYENISINEFSLNQNVLKVIQKLTQIFGESTKSTPKPVNTIKKDETWKRVEPFKPTQIEKPVGTANYTSDIRNYLNKLSEKTYETHKTNIINNIDSILNSDEPPEVIQQNITIVINSLFDIVSNNKFYSTIYANLYSELCLKYEFFNEITNTISSKYMSTIPNIISINPNEDYDKFCEVNKENDKRKSLITFIVNLTKKNTLSIDVVSNIYLELTDKLLIDDITYQPINDEIVENIFIIITLANEILRTTEKWEIIQAQIQTFSKYKSKEHPGLSNKSIFKYMDMVK